MNCFLHSLEKVLLYEKIVRMLHQLSYPFYEYINILQYKASLTSVLRAPKLETNVNFYYQNLSDVLNLYHWHTTFSGAH